MHGGFTAQRPYMTPPASDKLFQNARDEKWRVGHADPSMTDDPTVDNPRKALIQLHFGFWADW